MKILPLTFYCPFSNGRGTICRTMFFWRPMANKTADYVWLDWLGWYVGWVRR